MKRSISKKPLPKVVLQNNCVSMPVHDILNPESAKAKKWSEEISKSKETIRKTR